MNRQEAEQALRAWATIERDELVRAAHDAGVSKNRIFTITGIARTTIDRILDAPMQQAKTERLSHYLAAFTEQWPRPTSRPPFTFRVSPPIALARTAEQIAEELLGDAEFKALKLGTFLSTPDGQLLAAAVQALTPPPYREDIDLLLQALQLAAQRQHEAARETFTKGVVVALGAGALAALLSGGGN